MKGEGKVFLKSRMKWIGLLGLVLSAFSLLVHFLLAGFTDDSISDYSIPVTIFSWRPVFDNPRFARHTPLYRRLWGPTRHVETLLPDANPRGFHSDPPARTNGFVFVRIQGGFHEIRNSIPDVVAVSRLLNATLVIPEIQSTTSSKGISSQFKSFAYLYNEEHFMASIANDVRVVKTLPKNLKWARRKKQIPSFKVSYGSSPYYYLHHVLPVLIKHSVVELVVPHGGCLQAILPSDLEEYQRLRCRVAFHALQFRKEVQELSTKVLQRLRPLGRPFIAYDPGMTREALAYHGCAELFQDVHTELIQHKRAWMIKRGIVKGKLSVDSAEQRLAGLCPLMPEEVGILLRAYGYSWDTIIYVAGGEVFGGQRTLIPLHGMFENVVDRTSLSTSWELAKMYGREAKHNDIKKMTPPSIEEETKHDSSRSTRQRPQPLPPPPARPKYYNIEGWWGWVAESDNEPESTVIELRTNAHKLLWEAIDYVVSVEADVFISGFDRDGKGHPSFASLVMGHRLYQSASAKTFRPDRKQIAMLLEEIRDHMYEANHTWITSVRKLLKRSILEGLIESSKRSKAFSFLSHPVPECSCITRAHPVSNASLIEANLGVTHRCPQWMDGIVNERSKDNKNAEKEEDLDEEDLSSSGLFFGHKENGGNNNGNNETVNSEANNKEEGQLEDQEELEGGER
ncbi:GDP-fucose protein O-fucosyltransferase [Arabidopsis thaliana x Arabidopsis arenosa]|uniref:O-fucosyltransferase family protein n=1 Tax=Arabidopsis thaliana x Arabidopsis arenosa TaxID=1240361 RepID=A0A8T1ZLJ1_9BRAS|nr:GDP-fucose protein O-fucosyltransferase [Arabidopsis thaliana x Arabidopsis arenosa]